MNFNESEFAKQLVPFFYLKQGCDSLTSRKNQILALIQHHKCPVEGWDDLTIEWLLQNIALYDSNNFLHNCGAGEREARIYSNIVAKRHFYLGHGIGRSGDIAEVQPKAAGSSLMYKLTNYMVLDIIKLTGVQKATSCLVVPMATGMTITLCLLTLRKLRPQGKFVIWPRIDQKSCFKAIISAGYEPVIIQNKLEGNELRTDVDKVEASILKCKPEFVAAVMTTTSCFAPRGIDKLESIAAICKKYDVPHIINNAYGIQSSKCMHHIEQAARNGRVDAFIQSTDKNFMVPVGGSIIAGFDDKFISEIGRTYPGRASSSPIVDLFITLLSMGKSGYKELLNQRKLVKAYLTEKMSEIAAKHNQSLLVTPNNPISVAISVPSLAPKSTTELGSMLFTRGISGARVIYKDDKKLVENYEFLGWGSHHNSYPCSYLTAAAAIGMTKDDVDLFITKLDKCLEDSEKKKNKDEPL